MTVSTESPQTFTGYEGRTALTPRFRISRDNFNRRIVKGTIIGRKDQMMETGETDPYFVFQYNEQPSTEWAINLRDPYIIYKGEELNQLLAENEYVTLERDFIVPKGGIKFDTITKSENMKTGYIMHLSGSNVSENTPSTWSHMRGHILVPDKLFGPFRVTPSNMDSGFRESIRVGYISLWTGEARRVRLKYEGKSVDPALLPIVPLRVEGLTLSIR
jgi:hypothetical protein